MDKFMHRVPYEILAEIEKKKVTYAQEITRNIDVSYSHVINTLKWLEKNKLIKFEKEGSRKNIRLTKDGEELANAIVCVRKIIRRIEK